MTRTYAAKRLLEHGPLSFAEFKEITGWTHRTAWRAIERLMQFGQVKPIYRTGYGRRLYQLVC